MHTATIVQFQPVAKDLMTPGVISTHDHTSNCDTNVVLQLRKMQSGNDDSSEITFERIAKTKGKQNDDWEYKDI